jgi:hypothetical protein
LSGKIRRSFWIAGQADQLAGRPALQEVLQRLATQMTAGAGDEYPTHGGSLRLMN